MTRNNEFITRGGQRYDAPAVAVVDIHNEGVLCGSFKWTEGGAGVYTEDDILDNGSY